MEVEGPVWGMGGLGLQGHLCWIGQGHPPGTQNAVLVEAGLGPGLLQKFVHSVTVPGCVLGSEAAAATECRIPASGASSLFSVCVAGVQEEC